MGMNLGSMSKILKCTDANDIIAVKAFQRIVRDLSQLGESVVISCTKVMGVK